MGSGTGRFMSEWIWVRSWMFRIGSWKRCPPPKTLVFSRWTKKYFIQKARNQSALGYTTEQNQHLICPTGQKDLGQESWGIWGKEKRLSPSKNYQVLTTSLGKNLPPSLLPEDEGKYNWISNCGKACLYRYLFSGELPTINQHSLSYLFHSPHLWSAPWKNQPKINKESNSVRANQQLAT